MDQAESGKCCGVRVNSFDSIQTVGECPCRPRSGFSQPRVGGIDERTVEHHRVVPRMVEGKADVGDGLLEERPSLIAERVGQQVEPLGRQSREKSPTVAEMMRGCCMGDTGLGRQSAQREVFGPGLGNERGRAREQGPTEISVVIRVQEETMQPLIVLVVVSAAIRLIGWFGPEGLDSWPKAVSIGLAAMFALTGSAHFIQRRRTSPAGDPTIRSRLPLLVTRADVPRQRLGLETAVPTADRRHSVAGTDGDPTRFPRGVRTRRAGLTP